MQENLEIKCAADVINGKRTDQTAAVTLGFDCALIDLLPQSEPTEP